MSDDLLSERVDAHAKRKWFGRESRSSTTHSERDGVLAVSSLGKGYRGRRSSRTSALSVRRGEAVGLLGPNGAGKTTVFYMITGLVRPDKGDIELDGHDVTGLPMYRRARLGIGYLPQEASIFRGLNVEDNIRAVLEITEPDREAREATLEFAARGVRHRAAAQGALDRACRAASGGAARSRARSPAIRPSCCSTSPSPASIRSRSATSRISCGTSRAAASAC